MSTWIWDYCSFGIGGQFESVERCHPARALLAPTDVSRWDVFCLCVNKQTCKYLLGFIWENGSDFAGICHHSALLSVFYGETECV